MTERKRLTYFSAVGGFVGGLLSLLILIWYVGPENFRGVLLIPFEWSFVYPIAGAFFSAAISTRFNPDTFGALKGVAVSGLAFVSFCLIYGIGASLLMGTAGLPASLILGSALFIPLVFVMFGGILLGWVLLPIGAVYGALYKRRSNKPLNTDALKRAD